MKKIFKRTLFFLFQLIHYPFYRYAVVNLVNNDMLISVQKRYVQFYRYLMLENKTVFNKELVANKKLKVGFLAPFCCNSSFTPQLLLDSPKDIELYVYDLGINDSYASSLENSFKYRKIKTYMPVKSKIKRAFGDHFDFKKAAKTINNDELDVFIFVTGSIDLTLIKLIEELNVKALIAANTGSMIFPHEKVKKQLQIQLSPGYKIVDEKLFSFRKNSFIFTDCNFYSNIFPYDNRKINIEKKVSNKNKDIFINARLSKFSESYLYAVSELLKKDRNRFFYYMGREKQHLNKIEKYFLDNEVLSQTKYLGEFSTKKDSFGNIEDDGWQVCKKFLHESKVILDTFPEDGGSSKVEAFLSYTPIVAMGVEKNNVTNPSQHHYIKVLEIDEVTATDIEEYINIAENILNDSIDVVSICENQLEIGKSMTDNKSFWQKLINAIKD